MFKYLLFLFRLCFGEPIGVFGGLHNTRLSSELYELVGPEKLLALGLKEGSLKDENILRKFKNFHY